MKPFIVVGVGLLAVALWTVHAQSRTTTAGFQYLRLATHWLGTHPNIKVNLKACTVAREAVCQDFMAQPIGQGHFDQDAALREAVDALGQQGWELTEIIPDQVDPHRPATYWFKRARSQGPRLQSRRVVARGACSDKAARRSSGSDRPGDRLGLTVKDSIIVRSG
jgi:hypothetical protein